MRKDTRELLECFSGIISGKWKLMIIHALSDDEKRFGELADEIGGISDKVLSNQLKELESQRLLSRNVYPEVPPKVVYRLSKRGRELNAIVDEAIIWSRGYQKYCEKWNIEKE